MNPVTEWPHLYEAMQLLDDANIPGRTVPEQITNLIADLKRLEAMVEVNERKTTREQLLDRLNDDPCDVLSLLRDACLDEGTTERDAEARGWHWLAVNRKWPYRWFTGKPEWIWNTDFVDVAPRSDQIPLDLSRLLDTPTTRYSSSREALCAVVDIIASGKWNPPGD